MRWSLKTISNTEKVSQLQEALHVEKNIATLLVQRGIDTFEAAKSFFRPTLTALHNPFLMQDMDIAVKRIETAITQLQNIMVYGDYDVDGTTAVALMSSYLKTRTPQVTTYIPDRYDEGYGVSFKGIDYASDNNISLIIALDCGIKDIEKVAYANTLGIDFIICDHHLPGQQLPPAIAVLDPKRLDCNYPYKELCGCGVGFKLIQALAQQQHQSIETLVPYLDLVATAIGADIVPIDGENRVLAYFGLQTINTTPRAGIKVLMAQTQKQTLTITDVVFMIAPRINAAGRMKHGNYAVALLVEEDLETAKTLAEAINTLNEARRDADKIITDEALHQIIENNEQHKFTTVVYHPNWHKGVIGIVASRLTETYYRPTIVFTNNGDNLAASVRSVSGFDVYQALEACSVHITQFGGHKYAAGLTLKPENYQAFKNAFEDVVSKTIDKALLTPEIKVDLPITLPEITPKFYRILKQFSPFGPSNMTPVFMSENLIDTGKSKCVGEANAHLRLVVKQSQSNEFVGIGFNLGKKITLIEKQQPFKAVFNIEEHVWNGNTSLQLKLKDIQH